MFKPKKWLGQNFLRNREILELITSEIRKVAGKRIVEIGPGEGALTRSLTDFDLNLIEIDGDLIGGLRGNFPRAKIYQMDALNFNYRGISSPFTIVGNLPYNVATPLLFKFMEVFSAVEVMALMLQKEVGERLNATPETKSYGRLSVMFQLKFTVHKLIYVPASAFFPKPKVDSVFLIIYPKRLCSLRNEKHFSDIVRLAFNGRRKMLKNSLKAYRSVLAQWGERRPESLSVEEFIQLSDLTCDLSTK